MAEVTQIGVSNHGTARRKSAWRKSDMIAFVVIFAVVVVLAITLTSKLRLKHDITSARAVSDKVIVDISKRDGPAARTLGSANFQKTYTNDLLSKQFKAIELVTNADPTVDHQTVSHGKKTVAFIIYKYPPHLAKQPYFIRIAVTNNSGKWQLTNIAGSADESSLVVN